MSAVPKKKLCWNCEGNVSRDIDNCPYCGVYVHSCEEEDSAPRWKSSYQSFSEKEEIPQPLYQIPQASEEISQVKTPSEHSSYVFDILTSDLFAKLKQDLFPILFLMMGSVFFLFGIVLLLFSQDGTLTLQWQSHYGYYFLLIAAPLAFFGWKFLQRLETEE